MSTSTLSGYVNESKKQNTKNIGDEKMGRQMFTSWREGPRTRRVWARSKLVCQDVTCSSACGEKVPRQSGPGLESLGRLQNRVLRSGGLQFLRRPPPDQT